MCSFLARRNNLFLLQNKIFFLSFNLGLTEFLFFIFYNFGHKPPFYERHDIIIIALFINVSSVINLLNVIIGYENVTHILNVFRKFSMCINLILDTLKFTTINLRMNIIYNKSRSYYNNTTLLIHT